jgi:Tol biopolymer transport system component
MTVAIRRGTGRTDDLWLIESARGVLRRLTTAADAGGSLAWSPDGRRLAFSSRSLHPDHNDLFLKPVDGGPIEALLESAENKNVSDWSQDGRFILYTSQNPQSARDVWALSMEGDRKPGVVVRTSFDENLPLFSPDGSPTTRELLIGRSQ